MSETERPTAPVTVMLTPSAKAEVETAATTRGIPTSTLLRIVITEWLAANPARRRAAS